MHQRLVLRWVWLLALLPGWLWVAHAQTPPRTDVYLAQTIWTGKQSFSPGYLIVENGKVKEVGSTRNRTSPNPPQAKVHNLGKSFLMPGLIAAESSLAEKGRDDVRTMTPEVRALDGFDFYSDYQALLAGGVTTVQLAPGSKRLMPGQGAVVQLAGSYPHNRILKDRESLRILLGGSYKGAPRIYEPPIGAVSVDKPLDPTRPQIGGSLASVVAGLRATFAAAAQHQANGNGDTLDPSLDVVGEYMKPGHSIRITTPTVADIRAALNLAREFKLQLILVEPGDLRPFRTSLDQWKDVVVGVILDPEVRTNGIQDVPVRDESEPKPQSTQEKARWLLDAGITVALKPSNDADLQDLLYLAGLYRSRLSVDESLQMVTSHAAKLLGLADRIGSLEPKMQADFIVLSDQPFALRSRVDQVYIAGQKVYSALDRPRLGKAVPQRNLVTARYVYTGDGTIIPNGKILIEGSRIRGIGNDVSTSPEIPVLDFPNAYIVPGLLDMGCKLGLGGPPQGNSSLSTRLGELLLTSDPQSRLARSGGVTTVLMNVESPSPAPVPVVAFKLTDRPNVLMDPVAIKFNISGNLTVTGQAIRDALRSGKAYADSWTKYEADQAEYEKKLAEYNALKAKLPPAAKPEEKKEESKPDEKKSEDKKPESASSTKSPSSTLPPEPRAPAKPQQVAAMEPLRDLFSGKIPALVEARRYDQIQLALAIFCEEFKVRTALIGADDAHRMEEALQKHGVHVITGPLFMQSVDREQINLPLRLALAGIPIAFQSQASTGVQALPQAVRYVVRQGLGTHDALAGFTTTPAKLLGLEKRIGSLAAGKDADLVVLSGHPFAAATRVLAVMIDGQWVYRVEDDR